MKILLTGASGQVGYELERSLQGLGEVVAVDRSRMALDNLDQVRSVIREVKPQLIVNPAAYTAVDKAESEPQLAHRINAEAPGVMAEEAKRLGAALVHYSTDYVFPGNQPGARREGDATGPANVYGASKLAGEQAIAASGVPHLIFRTSWVYGMRGKNFLLTMLRLAQERDELRVVADQHGAPTWSRTIADTTALVLAQARGPGEGWWQDHGGIYHLASQGETTWHGFTQAILAQAGIDCRVLPITSAEYPVPAKRPEFSVLDSGKLMSQFCNLPSWQEALRLCMAG
ncbi:dTDP-4-dehydrorhamnose reductase [Pseudoduganella sp. OTU4001]|uniref:dTDP-4-dehydrorhamnose reductase n=1 Tax=Pseudoduganella sp. OTU4001 TaxID=3043854 RepID=UPI00313D0AF4